MEEITSKQNEKVKYIKSLNEKKFRYIYNSFYLEGIKVVDEILEIKAINIKFIAYSKDILNNVNGGIDIQKKLENIAKNNEIEILNFSKNIFEYVAQTVTSQGILAVLEMPKFNLDYLLNKNQDIVILDKIQDLGNLGTIIRTADAFSISTVICIEGTADIYSQKALRSTMASILRVKVIYIKLSELDDLIKKIKENKFKIITTSLNAKNTLNNFNFEQKNAFILGNESNGVSEPFITNADTLVKIEMSGNAQSLNVGISSGILLYKNFVEKKYKK